MNPATQSIIAVTGANGYIGSAVLSQAARRGIRVHALVRHPVADGGNGAFSQFHYDLAGDPPIDALEGASAVIHLAHAVLGAAADGETDPNVLATERLRDAARRAGVGRLVYVSSQSAATGAVSRYGKSKAAAEELMMAPGEVVVRPGMVYGGPEEALYGRFCAMARKSHLLALPRADAPIQPIHVDDLADGLLRLALDDALGQRSYALAAETPITLGYFLATIAELKFGRQVKIVNLPIHPFLVISRVLSRAHVKFRELSERLEGVAALTPIATGDSLRSLGLHLRDFEAALRSEAAP